MKELSKTKCWTRTNRCWWISARSGASPAKCSTRGGYRRFLGADPETGLALRELCEEQVVLADSFVVSDGIASLDVALSNAIAPIHSPSPISEKWERAGEGVLNFVQSRFYPELLDAITDEILALLSDGIPPSEIVILAPYLSDSLRFSLTNRLDARDIPWRSHRPSRSLRDEPASHALLTLAALAHPDWKIHPPKFDVAYALVQSIEGMDLVRAQLLPDIGNRQPHCSKA